MLPTTNNPQQLATAVNGLLDADYAGTAGRVVQAIFNNSNDGLIRRRLDEFNAEAARLADAGQRFDRDNAVLRALLADVQDTARANALMIRGAGGDIQASAIDLGGRVTKQLALPGDFEAALARIGSGWNAPDPEMLNAAIGFVDQPAWADEVGKYAPLVMQAIENVAITGLVQGWGARRMADELTSRVQDLPVSQADNLMRTLQGQAFREAQLAHRLANADILEGQIRIAALDDRTCLACIALHGTVYPINVRIDDHHRGRCTSIPLVRGRARDVQGGEGWFEALPEARQRRIAGQANYEAMQAGAVTLQDFVQGYRSPVFGSMVRQASLVSVLGDEARDYYGHGR